MRLASVSKRVPPGPGTKLVAVDVVHEGEAGGLERLRARVEGRGGLVDVGDRERLPVRNPRAHHVARAERPGIGDGRTEVARERREVDAGAHRRQAVGGELRRERRRRHLVGRAALDVAKAPLPRQRQGAIDVARLEPVPQAVELKCEPRGERPRRSGRRAGPTRGGSGAAAAATRPVETTWRNSRLLVMPRMLPERGRGGAGCNSYRRVRTATGEPAGFGRKSTARPTVPTATPLQWSRVAGLDSPRRRRTDRGAAAHPHRRRRRGQPRGIRGVPDVPWLHRRAGRQRPRGDRVHPAAAARRAAARSGAAGRGRVGSGARREERPAAAGRRSSSRCRRACFPATSCARRAAGCDLFLDKPCYPQRVADEIQRMLDDRRTAPARNGLGDCGGNARHGTPVARTCTGLGARTTPAS